MTKSFTAIAAALLLGASLQAAVAAPVVGQPAPAFSAKDEAGKTVSLSDYKGKIVVLEWTSSECPFVKKWYDSGNMQKLQSKAVADGVVWLTVDSSAPKNPGYMDGKAAAAWMSGHKAAPADVIIDASGAVGHLYEAKTTPHMFVVDKDGKLAYAGAIDSIASANPDDIAKADNYVEDAIASLKAGTPVKLASTKSYGCGVKY